MPSIINALTASGGGVAITGDATGNLALQTAGNTAVTIDTSQNVGIGGTPVSVASTKTLTIYDATEARIQLQNSTSGATSTDGSTIAVAGADLYINNRENGNQLFFVNGSERMRIDSSGNLLVGTTAGSGNLVLNNRDGQNFGSGLNFQKNGNGNPNYELVVGGDNKLYLGYSATTTPAAIGNFATNGTYTATSDIRKKKDISYKFNGLDIVSQLKPVQGRMLDDEESSPLRPMFIAQDMVNVLPSIVSSIEPSPSTDNPLLGIDYSSIIPILTKAIQEQQAMIEELKQEVAALKASH